jgi:hypothetical protein
MRAKSSAADFEEAGHEDVVRKIKTDFDAAGVAISEDDIRVRMIELLSEAVAQLQKKLNRYREAVALHLPIFDGRRGKRPAFRVKWQRSAEPAASPLRPACGEKVPAGG